MGKDNESTMKWKVDVSQLKAGMQDAKRSISLANAEFKTATAGMDKWQNSTTGLEAKIKQLNSTLPQQKTILQQLEQQYKLVAEEQGENSAEAQRLKIQIENQKAAIVKTETSIGNYNRKLKEMQTAESQLTNVISKQEAELSDLKTAYVNAVAQYGKNSKEAKALASQISNLSGELQKNKTKASEASKEADRLDKSLDGVGDSAEEAKGDVAGLSEGFTVMKGMMANLASQGVSMLISGLKDLGAALINTGKQAIASYADYEQLVGGVETLFGAGGMNIHEYAKSVGKTTAEVKKEYENLMSAQSNVLKNASEAFKTAGLSQNEYMETVTSFSASLISSLGGDTKKAAQVADQAIIDMSDNANKMGTSMTDIQNAYQGFAKQNYTMLDNLKLGYGGTKTEMERLIADANKMKVAQGELGDLTINSYADIIEAIHMVQDEMGITGTTQKEAATTITGSLNMTKAAWSNLLTGMADDGADFDKLIDDFVESALSFANNIIPRIKTTIVGMGKMITGLMKELVPKITAELPSIISEMIPMVVEAVQSVVGAVEDMLPAFVDMIPQMINSFGSMLPQMIIMGVNLITNLATGIIQNIPMLIEVGLKAVSTLFDSIGGALPKIIKLIPDLIKQIVKIINEQLPVILHAGVNMILSILYGIMETIPVLIEYLPTLIESIVTTLMTLLPEILHAGAMILMALIGGLVQMLPALVESLPLIINTICEVLMQNLPLVLQAAITLFHAVIEALPTIIRLLVQNVPLLVTTSTNILVKSLPLLLDAAIILFKGIIQALPTIIRLLIVEVPKLVTTIITTLLSQLPLLITAAIELFFGIITAIPQFLPDLAKAIPQIITELVDGLLDGVADMIDVGGDLVAGIWDGISGSLGWIKDKITGWVGNVTDFMKNLFGTHSPSKVMADEIGRWLPAGIAEGFEEDMPSALKDMKKSVNGALSELKTDVAIQTNGLMDAAKVNGSGSGSIDSGSKQQVVNFNQTINSPKAVDRMTLYRETNSLLFSAKVRLGNV